MCKVQAARAAGEHSLGAGVSIWSVDGSEVLVPRRRPPAGPQGHGEGRAEALSSQRAVVAGFWGWTGPPKGEGAVEQGPAGAWLSQCSRSKQGHRARGPSATSIPACRCCCMSSTRGQTGLQRGRPDHLWSTCFTDLHVLPPSGSEENIHSGARGLAGQEGPGMDGRTVE